MKTVCHAASPKFLFNAVLLLLVLLFVALPTAAQRRRFPVRPPAALKPIVSPTYLKYRKPLPAVVVTEKLAVLRFEPSLTAIPMQRMRTGRDVLIVGEQRATQAEGVMFFRVSLPPDKSGWVQAEALASQARRGDDERVAQLIRVTEGFDQLELTTVFLENFPRSTYRPAILLLAGDLAEVAAQKLSRDAARKLGAAEIEASRAPVHSFYLNFNELDRYRRLGINFVFNSTNKQFHYDGATWREIMQKHPDSMETAEARKRLGDSAND